MYPIKHIPQFVHYLGYCHRKSKLSTLPGFPLRDSSKKTDLMYLEVLVAKYYSPLFSGELDNFKKYSAFGVILVCREVLIKQPDAYHCWYADDSLEVREEIYELFFRQLTSRNVNCSLKIVLNVLKFREVHKIRTKVRLGFSYIYIYI
jgi:hypothetical protein